MRTKNCRNIRREIEEGHSNSFLSSRVIDHLASCPDCGKFKDEQEKLQSILSGLGTVEAPDDFYFKVRARLANETSSTRSLSNFGFGFRSVAFATLLMAFAATLLLVGLRWNNNAPVASVPPLNNTPVTSVQSTAAPVAIQTDKQTAVVDTTPLHASQVKPVVTRERGRTRTRDMAASPAPVFTSGDLTARATDFPIQSAKPLKVSVDNGRGSSRTISLPTVSFGSQRVLSQNTSPLIASARGSW